MCKDFGRDDSMDSRVKVVDFPGPWSLKHYTALIVGLCVRVRSRYWELFSLDCRRN